MSRDIKDEMRALYNELEGEFVALKREIGNDDESIRAYLKGRNLNSKLKDYILYSDTLSELIAKVGKKDSRISSSELVYTLFAHKYGRNQTVKRIVLEALKSTQDVKYVELASKLEMVGSAYAKDRYDNEKIRRAESLVDWVVQREVSYPHFPAEAKTTVLDWKGKTRTVKSELSYINKTVRRQNRKEKALTNKYRNVDLLDRTLYKLLPKFEAFFRAHDCDIPQDINSARSIDWVRKAVLNNRYDFIRMLDGLEELEFVHKAKGRIR